MTHDCIVSLISLLLIQALKQSISPNALIEGNNDKTEPENTTECKECKVNEFKKTENGECEPISLICKNNSCPINYYRKKIDEDCVPVADEYEYNPCVDISCPINKYRKELNGECISVPEHTSIETACKYTMNSIMQTICIFCCCLVICIFIVLTLKPPFIVSPLRSWLSKHTL
tara:strand:- start:218 stop:739 length:522 start_codon:yes stop_codon:yes gene_type:complete